MDQIKKMIQVLESVKPEGRLDMGLAVNKSGAAVKWGEFLTPGVLIEVFGEENEDEAIEQMKAGIENGKWILLEIKGPIGGTLYRHLRSLSASNRMQIGDGDARDLVMGENTRIIATGLKEVLDRVSEYYPDFRSLFGVIIEL